MVKDKVLSKEEENIFEAIKSARKIQDFLWGEQNEKWDLEEWKRMFRKRIAKIDEIEADNPHSFVELKKRLLQTAAISINLLTRLELKKRLLQTAAISINLLTRLELKKIPEKKSKIPSNLDNYSKN